MVDQVETPIGSEPLVFGKIQNDGSAVDAEADVFDGVVATVRVDGQAVVLNLSEHRRLSPERSLDLVNHSPMNQPKLLTGYKRITAYEHRQ